MSRSVTYRERDTEWEEQPRRTYTTVKRYQVPESSTRSSRHDEEDVKDRIVIKRTERRDASHDNSRDDIDVRITERHEGSRDDYDYRVTERVRERPREEEEFRFSERTTTTERDREPRRDVTYRVVERERERDSDHHSRSGRSDYRSDFKFVERDREVTRAPSPPSPERVREFRFERERSFSPPERGERERTRDHYDVERYSKSTEYFAQPAPQPIIIRESAPQPQIIIREERRDPAPIIIREERREAPRFEFIEREEVKEDKALVKREEPPSPAPAPSEVKSTTKSVVKSEHKQEEEDYFYERRIREVDRRHHDEVRPRDSASNYSSDDSYEYYRREKTYDDRDRSHSPHHKRHLAEGAIAGIGAAEILRHHRRAEGKDPGGRIKSTLGGAAVGALGAEAITRYRSKSRRRGSDSRSRSRSGDRRDRHDRRRHRSRSRSRSRSKSISRKQLGGLAAVVAAGAIAGYALKNRGKNQETIIVNDRPPRRSHSRRHRGGSPDAYLMDQEPDKHRDPGHRNRRIAQAGLASAAAAGIFERVRSKSRHRSKSRLRTGVPIAAAGLGGAALAGLYEKNKASKEAKRDAIVQDELHRGRRRSSRSRSRSVPRSAYQEDGRRGPPVDDRGMIAYGDEPIYPDQARAYSPDEEPGMYRRRHRGGGSGASSPDTRRRSRSRGHDYADAGIGAGLGVAAAHEIGRRRGERDRRHDDHLRNDSYGYDHGRGPYSPVQGGYLPPQDQYAQHPSFGQPQSGYPQGPYFPPPPTAEHAYAAPYQQYPEPAPNAYPAYNPAEYSANAPDLSTQPHPYANTRDIPGESAAAATPAVDGHTENNHHATDHGAPGSPRPGRNGGRRESPENVSDHQAHTEHDSIPAVEEERDRGGEGASAGMSSYQPQMEDASEDDHQQHYTRLTRTPTDGVDMPTDDGEHTPRARSSSHVRFNLNANEEHSPESRRKSSRHEGDSQTESEQHSSDTRHGRHRRRSRDSDHRRSHDGASDSPHLMTDPYDRHTRGASRTDEDDSDSTIDLPPRFDSSGNRRHPDANSGNTTFSDLLLGRDGQGGLLSSFLSGSGHAGIDEAGSEGRSERRRRRR